MVGTPRVTGSIAAAPGWDEIIALEGRAIEAAESKRLRDQFALAALQGLSVPQEWWAEMAQTGADVSRVASAIANTAYRIADAMMAEREKEQP